MRFNLAFISKKSSSIRTFFQKKFVRGPFNRKNSLFCRFLRGKNEGRGRPARRIRLCCSSDAPHFFFKRTERLRRRKKIQIGIEIERRKGTPSAQTAANTAVQFNTFVDSLGSLGLMFLMALAGKAEVSLRLIHLEDHRIH